MRYAIWNNKGGVGKTFLSFILSTERAHRTGKPVVVVDMCPQANLSEIILGGNGNGSKVLEGLINARKTVGGYFDERISSPHKKSGTENKYLVNGYSINKKLPQNLHLIPGDPGLEIQAQVINQIGSQSLPVDSWRNVHLWLSDLIEGCCEELGDEPTVFIDCNPSFAAYTELSILASDYLIVPCSSDGSSARAIDNIGALVYGYTQGMNYGAASFAHKAIASKLPLPKIHSVLLNRSTQYNHRASKAFMAMFNAIQTRVLNLENNVPAAFNGAHPVHQDIPDSHSVAIVCSHLGLPLYEISTGQYPVHDQFPQVNPEPLERYKNAIDDLMDTLL